MYMEHFEICTLTVIKKNSIIVPNTPAVTSPCTLCKTIFPARVHGARAKSSKLNKWGMEGRKVWGAAARLWWGFSGNVYWFLVVTSRLLVNVCTRLEQRAPNRSWVHAVLRKSGWTDHRCNRPTEVKFWWPIFSKSKIHSRKIVKLWQLIWPFQTSAKFSASDP